MYNLPKYYSITIKFHRLVKMTIKIKVTKLHNCLLKKTLQKIRQLSLKAKKLVQQKMS